VRRIFREFAAGKSPQAIANDLNAEGIPGPRGDIRRETSIRGHVNRGTGIINNALYIGRLVWNRLRYIKDPDTGKRVSRLNPKEEWIVREVPELRIVDDALWEHVRARQAQIARQFEAVIAGVRAHHAVRARRVRRPRHLLSGLLVCGICGGNYAIVGKERYGCSNRRDRRGCTNSRTIRVGEIEARVLVRLKHSLAAPEAAAVAVRGFKEETRRLRRERAVAAEADRRTIEAAARRIREIVGIIEDGGGHSALIARLDELERQKTEAEARLARRPADRPDATPDIDKVYRAKIADLAPTLADPDARLQAGEHIRTLVGRAVLTPGARRGEVDIALIPDPEAVTRKEEG